MTKEKIRMTKEIQMPSDQNIKRNYSRRAFTLVELMLVIVIMGIIAGFTVPNYGRAVGRAYMRDGRNNLIIIKEANQINRAQQGVYWPATAVVQNLAAINTNLRLNILANGSTYTCVGVAGGATFTCTALRATGVTYTATVDERPILLPTSNAATSCTLGCGTALATRCNPCCDGGAC